MDKKWLRTIRSFVLVSLASFVMALNIKTFVRTGDLVPGGVTGLSLLIQRVCERFLGLSLPYTVINVVLNLVPVYIGFRYIGKKFTGLSCYMIVLSSVLTDLIPSLPITYDTLLISVFGGIVNGFVVTLCLLAGATSGGTDFISIFLSERTRIDSWNVIFGFNVVVLLCAGFLFGWDRALYSIIFQFVSTQIIKTFYGRYQQETLFIVTEYPEKVCDVIISVSNHDATVMQGEGAYGGASKKVVYSVVSRGEYKAIIKAVKKADPQAFVNCVRTDALVGRFYTRPQE